MDFNLETGLPDLPKGCFWSVIEDCEITWTTPKQAGELTRGLYTDGYKVCIKVKRVVKESHLKYYKKHWWSDREVIHVPAEFEEEVIAEDFIRVKDSTNFFKSMGVRDQILQEIDEKSVTSAAVRVLLDWQERIAENEKEVTAVEKNKRLLGDYPPKSLLN